MSNRKVAVVTNWQALMLVLLRVAIGWHFLREGVVKLTKPGWSSKAYLQNASGPLADKFHALAESDGSTPIVAAELADVQGLVKTLAEAEDSLSMDLQARLGDDTRELLYAAYDSQKVPPELTAALARDFNKITDTEQLYSAELFADVKLPEALQRKAEQATGGDARAQVNRKLFVAAYPKHIPPSANVLFVTDLLTKWGLTLVGLGLLTGTFTRLSCLGGMAFLVLFYLALPPWPETLTVSGAMNQLAHPLWAGLPQPGREGNYLYIDKNCVEFLALAVLLAFNTGRFMGLDALCRRGRRAQIADSAGGAD